MDIKGKRGNEGSEIYVVKGGSTGVLPINHV